MNMKDIAQSLYIRIHRNITRVKCFIVIEY